MRTAYFHIGTSKTGTSALQSFLSFNNNFAHPLTGQNFLYCCLVARGKVLYGNELSERTKDSPTGYIVSHPNVAVSANMAASRTNLDRIFAAGFTPIFSQESWSDEAHNFIASGFFKKLDIAAKIIIYVRPQVEWFNSAWWQWFAWMQSFPKPADVFAGGYEFVLWRNKIEQWRNIDGVQSVTVRLYPPDIIADFFSLLGMKPPPGNRELLRSNKSLPPTLIKLLLKYPQLRGPHDSFVDGILQSHFSFPGESPWVIEPALAAQIINATRANNEMLCAMLDENSRAAMQSDPRWWHAEHYQNRRVCKTEDLELSTGEMEALLEQAIPALIKFAEIN